MSKARAELEKLKRQIEEAKSAPMLVKAKKAEEGLGTVLSLLEILVEQGEKDNGN